MIINIVFACEIIKPIILGDSAITKFSRTPDVILILNMK